MRKKVQAVLAIMLVLTAVLVPASTGFAAGWKYSYDGRYGINIYLPEDGQTIYTDTGFSFEFEQEAEENGNWDYMASLFRVDEYGEVDLTSPAKNFDIGNATRNNGRWVITLDVSDVEPGYYAFVFMIGEESEIAIAADVRIVYIAKRTSEWKKFSGGWSYSVNGKWATNKWELINGKWYRFNSSGYMLTNWQKIGGSWYYFGGDGAMRTGWQAIGGKWYCFRNSGAMYSNTWLESDESWYAINSSGVMLTGWQRINNAWYYLSPSSGKMHKGWLSLGGKWYFFDNGGKMVTGTGTIDGKRYTFNSSGVLVS